MKGETSMDCRVKGYQASLKTRDIGHISKSNRVTIIAPDIRIPKGFNRSPRISVPYVLPWLCLAHIIKTVPQGLIEDVDVGSRVGNDTPIERVVIRCRCEGDSRCHRKAA